MAHIKAVTAYIDLGLSKRPSAEFHELGHDLLQALDLDGKCYRSPLDECWLAQEVRHPVYAANPRAEDRFATDAEHVRSNLVQHSPVQWLRRAYDEFPGVDVFVWMGYSLLKQGDFTGKRITQQHIRDFVSALKDWKPEGIVLPGITARAPVSVHGDNWRFCGSTLVVPQQYVPAVERSYKVCAREFLRKHGCVPIDLAIWPTVEETSGLPIRWYQAEYDYTQLTNFPFKG